MKEKDFWRFVESEARCSQCPFEDECNSGRFTDEDECADILELLYKENFSEC